MDFMGLHAENQDSTESVSPRLKHHNFDAKEKDFIILEEKLKALEVKQQKFDNVIRKMNERIKFLEDLDSKFPSKVWGRMQYCRDYLFLSFPAEEMKRFSSSDLNAKNYMYSEELENECIDQLMWFLSTYPVCELKEFPAKVLHWFSKEEFLQTCKIALKLALNNRKDPRARMKQTLNRFLLSSKSSIKLQLKLSKLEDDAVEMHKYLSHNRTEKYSMLLS